MFFDDSADHQRRMFRRGGASKPAIQAGGAEGFYFVPPNQLNPHSSYHLSFNLGYPNRYDRAHGYTGSYLMVHGNKVSIGCYAMTDPVIEEIWTLMDAAYRQGQPFIRVHIFPFRMTPGNMDRHGDGPWHEFWENNKTHSEVP